MKVSLNTGTCQANAFCEQVAPQIFQVDDDETTNLYADRELPPELEAAAREAVDVCPVVALTLSQ